MPAWMPGSSPEARAAPPTERPEIVPVVPSVVPLFGPLSLPCHCIEAYVGTNGFILLSSFQTHSLKSPSRRAPNEVACSSFDRELVENTSESGKFEKEFEYNFERSDGKKRNVINKLIRQPF